MVINQNIENTFIDSEQIKVTTTKVKTINWNSNVSTFNKGIPFVFIFSSIFQFKDNQSMSRNLSF